MESCSSYNSLDSNINAFYQMLPKFSDLGTISQLSSNEFTNCTYLFEKIIQQIDINAFECVKSGNFAGLNQNYKITDELKKGLCIPERVLSEVYRSMVSVHALENEKLIKTISAIRVHLESMLTQIVTLEEKWNPALLQQQLPILQAEKAASSKTNNPSSPPIKSNNLSSVNRTSENNLEKNILQFKTLLLQCNDIKNIKNMNFCKRFFDSSNDFVSLILNQVHILFEKSMKSGNVDEHNEIYSITDPIKRNLLTVRNTLASVSYSYPSHRESIENFRHHLQILRTQILSQQDEWESAFLKQYPISDQTNFVDLTTPVSFPIQEENALQRNVEAFIELLSRCNDINTFPRQEFDLFISEHLPLFLKQISIISLEYIKSDNIPAIDGKKNLILKLKAVIQETSSTLTALYNSSPNLKQRDDVIAIGCQFKKAFENFESLEYSLAIMLLQQQFSSGNQSQNELVIAFNIPQIQEMLIIEPPAILHPIRSNNPKFIDLHNIVDKFIGILSRCNDIDNFPHIEYNEFTRDYLPLILEQMNSNAMDIINSKSHLDNDPELSEIADISTKLKVKVKETKDTLRELFKLTNSKQSDALICRLKEFDTLHENIETMQKKWVLEIAKKLRSEVVNIL